MMKIQRKYNIVLENITFPASQKLGKLPSLLFGKRFFPYCWTLPLILCSLKLKRIRKASLMFVTLNFCLLASRLPFSVAKSHGKLPYHADSSMTFTLVLSLIILITKEWIRARDGLKTKRSPLEVRIKENRKTPSVRYSRVRSDLASWNANYSMSMSKRLNKVQLNI